MKTGKIALIVALSFICGVAVAQDNKTAPTKLKKAPITKELLAKAGNKVRLSKNNGAENVAGPNDGQSCATPNRSTSKTSHKGVSVECSVDGRAASCTCDVDCDYVCENYKASESCTATSCTVSLSGGGSGSGGAAQVVTSF